MNRRSFIQHTAVAGAIFSASPLALSSRSVARELEAPFDIALSQWAFNKGIFGDSRDNEKWFRATLRSDPEKVLRGEMDPRDVVVVARKMGIHAVDLVNNMWFGHRDDKPWLRDFKQQAENEGVSFICLMCDVFEHIGVKSKTDRQKSIDQHSYWLEAAAELGCTQMRINPYGEGSYLEQLRQCAEGLHEMSERAQRLGIQLVVENHGHPASNGAWLAMLVEMTAHENFGVYLDFDNFFMGGWGIEPQRRYDRRQGILDLASHTVGVSAKTRRFLGNGEEEFIDYDWCVRTLLEHGFKGYMCAEYAGDQFSELEGSTKTVNLLRTLQEKYEGFSLQQPGG